jgi:hypothetical protein
MSLCFNINLFILMLRVSSFVRHKSSCLKTLAQEMKANRFYWTETKGTCLSFCCKFPWWESYFCSILSFGWFPGVWILCADISEHYVFKDSVSTAYADGTVCSETLAHKIQMQGNQKKKRIQHSEYGQSIKSRGLFLLWAWKSSETNHSTRPRLKYIN